MMRKRRKIRYYNGPAYAVKLTQKVWFPFAAVAVAALVLGLIVGLILSAVSEDSKLSRLPARELTEFGGVENPSEKYASLPDIKAEVIGLSEMSESALKKAISNADGDTAAFMMFDGSLHYNSVAGVGYEGGGTLTAENVASCADARADYSVALFVSSAFEEEDTAKRAYEKGRELALLAELADAGFREILIFGLPDDEALLTEVNLFVAAVREFSPKTAIGVVLGGAANDAALARLVAATEAYADSYALDLRGMGDEGADAVERNAYFLTQYRARVLLDNTELTSAYELNSWILWKTE